MASKASRPGQRRKGIEEVVQYALGHFIRIHVLVLLHEGTYTAAQIAQMIGEPLNNVSNHIRELLDAGSIEIAKTEQKGNIVQHHYRFKLGFCSREEAEAMTPVERQVTAGLVVQSAGAEAIAALYAGNLTDPRTVLYWDWHNVDQQGREDLEEEQERFLFRVQEIEAEATDRQAVSGEAPQPMLVTLFGYQRARKARESPSSRNRERRSPRD